VEEAKEESEQNFPDSMQKDEENYDSLEEESNVQGYD